MDTDTARSENALTPFADGVWLASEPVRIVRYHHMFIGEWARAFPEARVHGPVALRTKRPDLRIDRVHDQEPLGELGATFDEVHIDGFSLEESVLVHRPSKTLLVADLVHNIGRPAGGWTALYSRAMGFYGRVAISRMIR
jgi:hypothetical protein